MIHTPGWSITSLSFSWHPARNPVCLVQYYMIWLPELLEQANLCGASPHQFLAATMRISLLYAKKWPFRVLMQDELINMCTARLHTIN
ncbi:hypothetical protein ACB092_01G312200 [Castanea dentata]